MSINNALPESLRGKLSLSVELRSRFELRDNFDFDDATDDEDGFYLFRTRINFDVNAYEHVRGYVQLQDSRIWESEFAVKTAFEDDLDFRQGYLDIGNPGGNVKVLAGYSHFFTGDFLTETGSDDDGDFFYLQATLSF